MKTVNEKTVRRIDAMSSEIITTIAYSIYKGEKTVIKYQKRKKRKIQTHNEKQVVEFSQLREEE